VKFRTNKVKHEHSTTNDLKGLFAAISASPYAKSVLPGVLKRKQGHEQGLTFQYLQGGTAKFLARGNGLVQEVFVVTPDCEALLAELRQRGLLKAPGGGREDGPAAGPDAGPAPTGRPTRG
jgi:hypothetical protein